MEIGCGKGGMLYYLITEGYEAEGVEKNQEHIEKANRIYGNLPIKKVDGVELPYESNTFNVVMSFDVLERIPNTDGHLKEVGRVLKVGDHIFSSHQTNGQIQYLKRFVGEA